MVTEAELEVLAEQLGRRPRGVRAIERYCPAGHPQVIRVYPLIDGNPFPTLFWLTCPELIKQLTRLEYEGVIEALERLIERDPRFRARYHQNHRDYIEERWKELNEHDRRWVEEQGLSAVFKERGIGGLRNWDAVKCLHMHYAHHKARANVIGEWLESRFDLRECGGPTG